MKLRRAGRPEPLRVSLRAPSAEARVAFTLSRRRGAKYRRYARGTTSAALR